MTGDGRRVREDGVTGEAEEVQRTRCGLLVACPARVGDHHGDVAQVRPVPDRRLDPNFGGDAADRETVDPQVAQRGVKEGSFEGAPSDLVGDGLTIQRLELGHDARVWRLARDRGTPPPRHSRPAARPSAA